MNNKLISTKNIVMTLNLLKKKKKREINWNLFDVRSDPDPELDPADPLSRK